METVGPPPVDEELNLLTDWGDPNARARMPKAAIGSVLFHIAAIVILINLPSGSYQEPKTEEKPHIVTPLVIPAELTQKAPNKGKITKEFDAREEAPRQALNHPPAPPPTAPNPQPPRPAVIPAPPSPKPAAALPAMPEPPKLEAPKEQPKPDMPAVAQITPQLPPQIQPTEAPKMPLENVPPASRPLPPGRGRIPIPGTDLHDVMSDVIHGSNGIAIGDQGALGSGYGSINQAPGNGVPGAAMQLLSDPGGADFIPYIRQILQTIKRNWLAVQPESVRMGRRGKVVLQFQIKTNGVVDKVVFEEHSGADALDCAAVAGISASNPLPPLPAEFKGDRVVLRLNFMYNMPRR